MADLISRDAVLEEARPLESLDSLSHYANVFVVDVDDIKNLPTVNAVPVVHARWIDEIEQNAVTSSGKEVHFFRCSACNFTWNNKTAVSHYFKFCPNCGARMDGEENASD